MNNPIDIYKGDPNRQNAMQSVLAVPAWQMPEPEPQSQADKLDLRAIYYALLRQRFVIAFFILLAVGLAVILTANQQRMFTASARVVLNTSDYDGAQKKDGDGTVAPPLSSEIVDTEVEVIRSRDLATSVAQGLALDRNPDFNPALTPHQSLMDKVWGAIGLGAAPKAGKSSTAQPRPPIQSAVINRLLDSLSVQRVESTYAFDIAITAPSPETAQAIANEYANQYSQLYLEQKRTSSSKAAEFLAKRLEGLRDQAQADTARVQEYRIANNLLSTTGATLSEQEISTYNEQTAAARAQANQDLARLATARSQLRKGSNGGDVGEALNSGVVSQLRAQRALVSARLASLQAQFGPLYPSVQKTQKELNDVDAQLAEEIKRIVSNLEAKVKVTSAGLASVQGSLGSARGQLASNNRAMVGLDDLTRREEASQQLYESYLTQYKQIVANQGNERANSRIISYADLPSAAVRPRPMLNIIIALALGTGIGVVVGLLREVLLSGLTTARDIESRLHVRGLGNIPLLRSVLPHERSPVSAIIEHQQSGFFEAFRALRTSIEYAVKGSQVLLITSALPREGKTTTSNCLAHMSALGGERVVLVDVDVRNRGTSNMTAYGQSRAGLIEVLLHEATLDEVLIQDPQSMAWILPVRGSADNIGNLLLGVEMDQLISELRERFDLVILDAAPVLPVADTRVLAAKADAIVMVSRWRSTADHAVRAALRLLPLDLVPIAGIALSQVDLRKQAQFGYGDYGLYYDQYKNYYENNSSK